MKPSTAMGDRHKRKHKRREVACAEALTIHQESIHKATLKYLMSQVADPENPGQQIPLYELEQRQRARHYRHTV